MAVSRPICQGIVERTKQPCTRFATCLARWGVWGEQWQFFCSYHVKGHSLWINLEYLMLIMSIQREERANRAEKVGVS